MRLMPGEFVQARHFGGSSPKAPPPPPPPPEKSDMDVQAEAAKQRDAARKRKGRASTVLTGDTSFLQPSDTPGKATLGG